MSAGRLFTAATRHNKAMFLILQVSSRGIPFTSFKGLTEANQAFSSDLLQSLSECGHVNVVILFYSLRLIVIVHVL